MHHNNSVGKFDESYKGKEPSPPFHAYSQYLEPILPLTWIEEFGFDKYMKLQGCNNGVLPCSSSSFFNFSSNILQFTYFSKLPLFTFSPTALFLRYCFIHHFPLTESHLIISSKNNNPTNIIPS